MFIGHGPAFRKGYVTQAFDNIELYNLMCGELIRFTPHTNRNSDV